MITASIFKTAIFSSFSNIGTTRAISNSSFMCKKHWTHIGYDTIVNTKRENKAKDLWKTKYEKPKEKFRGVIEVWSSMTVKDLATQMDKEIEHVQEAMLYVESNKIKDIKPHVRIHDFQILKEIAKNCGYNIKAVPSPASRNESAKEEEQEDKDVHPQPPAPDHLLQPRPPVITVMGHVDHGKTTLLDTLRDASVAESEAGGITQHIGAFTVELNSGEKVTFLDTPGHAAFSSMRARGAKCTDIIVLVVAAEDGVMQQTKEVIQLAKEENVPMIVAINKIDMPNANVEKTKQNLLSCGVNLEGYGGDVQYIEISALHGTNLDTLCEAIWLQSQVMDLKSDYDGLVEGVIIESRVDQRRGRLTTAIITRGTLRKGVYLVSDLASAKVRAMFDHDNQPIEVATPGMPVEIIGWRDLPFAGEPLFEVENDQKAHSVINYRKQKALREKAEIDLATIQTRRQEHDTKYHQARMERLQLRREGIMRKRKGFREKAYVEDGQPKLNIIIKGDVNGSVEAILDVLDSYHSSDLCKMSVVHYGVGPVTDGDIELARTFNAIVYSFSQKLPPKRPNDVVMREFNVIYRLIEDLKKELNSRLPEIDVEEKLGEAQVMQIFKINEKNKKATVLGCRCTSGVLKKANSFKLLRDGEVLADGKLTSMRHLKSEVESIKTNVECGLRFEDQDAEPQEGDVVLCYHLVKQKQYIDWDPGFQEKK